MATNNIFSIVPTNYPTTILLGTKTYSLTFNTTNYTDQPKKFKFKFSGEGIDIKIPKKLENAIEIKENTTKSISIDVTPKINGQVKIIINTDHHKVVNYTEMVWYVRKIITDDIVQEGLSQSYFQMKNFVPTPIYDLPTYSGATTQISLEQAQAEIEKINRPPPPPPEPGPPIPKIDPKTGKPIEMIDPETGQTLIDPATGRPKLQMFIPEPPPSPPVLTEQEKNQARLMIAKNVFKSNPDYGFQIVNEISDINIQLPIYYEFLLPYASINLKGSLEKISQLSDENAKEQFKNNIICSLISKDIQKAISLVGEINTTSLKEELLLRIINTSANSDIKLALSLINQIITPSLKEEVLSGLLGILYKVDIDETLKLIKLLTDIKTQLAIIYEIVKFLYNSDKKKCNKVIIVLINKAIEQNNLQILKYGILFLGALMNPQAAVDMIEKLPENLKKGINEVLYAKLWEEVEVPRTRIDEISVSSVYYSFNSAAKPTKSIEMVSELGGNISENLLTEDFSSFVGIITPFGFNFPIFPSIERCYAEIKREKQKSFYYLIIPTKNKTEEDFIFIQTMLNMWFVANIEKFENKVYLFNLDFIPYLSKPTIIMGSDPEENVVIKSIVDRVFKDSVSFIIDDGLFKDGMINKILSKILPSNKFKIINLVMTYDFLNNYVLFKNFMSEFIK